MPDRRFIPIAAPMLIGNEKRYVLDCLDSSWISSAGKYVDDFEAAFGAFCGTRHAIGCCNGTAALHLALLALGIGPGDEVVVPTLTFVATANAVTYCGARPVFVDSDPETWNMDAGLLESKIGPATKAIIPVHLYGHPADMDAILSIARSNGLFVIEDSAQAHGASYRGRRTGSIGDIGVFSLYGNKVLTTGEGGVVVTDDEELALRVRLFRGQGMDVNKRYWFPVIGYNYRMTNLEAAIGLAQVEAAQWHLDRRAEVHHWYRERLQNHAGITWQPERDGCTPAHWMFTVVLAEDIRTDRDSLIRILMDQGIETRPVFYPMHVLPPYRDSSRDDSFPVADRISQWGLSLPTWDGLSHSDVDYVCDRLLDAVS